jgi:hypothetical protein
LPQWLGSGNLAVWTGDFVHFGTSDQDATGNNSYATTVLGLSKNQLATSGRHPDAIGIDDWLDLSGHIRHER